MFKVCGDTVYKWKNLKNKTGDINPKVSYQNGHSKIIKDIDELHAFIRENNDKTIAELANMWKSKISQSGMWRYLKKLGYTYKKTLIHPKRDVGSRNEFIDG